ncbi:MAG: hypothetical protein WA705_19970 [Candidatus Ozemobacteraceae bacterium]
MLTPRGGPSTLKNPFPRGLCANILLVILFTLLVQVFPAHAEITSHLATSTATASHKLDKVARSWGVNLFMVNGYQTMIEPRIAFIKRKSGHSEVIEYSWRPMIIKDMPHKERIDHIKFSFNRYYFTGKNKRSFYGAGIGGNIILFNQALKDWGKERSIDLKDGVNGLGRVFIGHKLSEIKFMGDTYPVVVRVDGILSPPYDFGGNLGQAGNRLTFTEVRAALNFSVE